MIHKFTEEMINASVSQTEKRDPDLKPHFDNINMTKEQGHQIGFLGEFAACTHFGLNWQDNIRDNYKTIDTFDLMLGNAKVDVKTESVPENIFNNLKAYYVRKSPPSSQLYSHIEHRPYLQHKFIFDDKPYGRRLINAGQRDELMKKHIVLFGAVNRDSMVESGKFLSGLSGWLPIGYISVNNAIKYPEIIKKPYKAKKPNYPTAVMAIKSSDLLSIEHLQKRYQLAKSKKA